MQSSSRTSVKGQTSALHRNSTMKKLSSLLSSAMWMRKRSVQVNDGTNIESNESPKICSDKIYAKPPSGSNIAPNEIRSKQNQPNKVYSRETSPTEKLTAVSSRIVVVGSTKDSSQSSYNTENMNKQSFASSKMVGNQYDLSLQKGQLQATHTPSSSTVSNSSRSSRSNITSSADDTFTSAKVLSNCGSSSGMNKPSNANYKSSSTANDYRIKSTDKGNVTSSISTTSSYGTAKSDTTSSLASSLYFKHQQSLPQQAASAKPLCCDKCDGKHETDDCPYYKKKREDHPDAQKNKQIGGFSSLPGSILSNARVVKQPGDGSCLFHSMSYGLPVKSNATRLRAEICQFICNNPQLTISDTPLQDWVKWDSQGATVWEYSKKMSRGSWGGGIEMACLSQLKDCNVHVYERGGGYYKRISAFDHPLNPETKPIVRVLYCGGVHYDALVAT